MRSVAKSYREGFLIYEEIRKYLTIYEETFKSYITLQPIHSEFPYILGKFSFSFFYQYTEHGCRKYVIQPTQSKILNLKNTWFKVIIFHSEINLNESHETVHVF
jgi:hypothetical protein